jgi:hypothetical protein
MRDKPKGGMRLKSEKKEEHHKSEKKHEGHHKEHR